ncbi:EAL domain-containing protein [Hydrogenimonas sp.]
MTDRGIFDNLKLKLFLIFLVPGLGMLFFSSKLFWERIDTYQATARLERIVHYTRLTDRLIQELQKERGLSIAYLSNGSPFFRGKLRRQYPETNEALKRFEAGIEPDDASYDPIPLKEALHEANRLETVRRDVLNKRLDTRRVFDFYSRLIARLVQTPNLRPIKTVNDTFFYAINFYVDLLKLAEIAGKERAVITYILENPSKAREAEKLLVNLEHAFLATRAKIFDDTPPAFVKIYYDHVDPAVEKRFQEYKKAFLPVEGGLQNGKPRLESRGWWQLSTRYINALYKADEAVLKVLLRLKDDLYEKAATTFVVGLLLWLLSLVALAVLLRIISRLVDETDRLMHSNEERTLFYQTLSEFAEIVLYHDDEETLTNTLVILLFQTGKFKYLWLARIEEDGLVPVETQGISAATIHEALRTRSGGYLKLQENIDQAVRNGRYIIAPKGTEPSPLYEGVGHFGIFPVRYEEKEPPRYVLVSATPENVEYDLAIIDLANKMVSALAYALNKIAMEAKERHLKEELRLAAYAFNTHEAITITDATGHIVKVNDAFTRITGYGKEEVVGQNPSILKSGKHDKAFYNRMWESIRKNGYWKGEIYNRRKNGEIYPELLSISAIKDAEGHTTHYIAHFFDITDIKEAQKEAEHRALHDPLTDLPNRQMMMTVLQNVWNNAKSERSCHALLFIDLDNFKSVNDAYSHEVGDKLLVYVAGRLRELLQEKDFVARISGDEFVVVTHTLGHTKEDATQNVSILLERIEKSFSEPVEIDGYRIDITFSIGVRIFPDREREVREILMDADVAMYHAKKNGKNQFCFYDDRLDLASRSFLLTKNGLEEALENHELQIFYQPKVAVADGSVAGFEALLRWRHPEKGLLLPESFMHVAHGNNLGHRIQSFVIEEICRQVRRWQEKGLWRDLRVSINISGEQFSRNEFADTFLALAARHLENPTPLDIEITEESLLHHFGHAIETVEALKAEGVTISLDDFGTGYSSLKYLQQLPIDTLKIDKSFILDLFEGKNAELVRLIVQTGKLFGNSIVAEGVEDEETLRYLREIGCDYYQGFLFAKPLPPEEVEARFFATQ